LQNVTKHFLCKFNVMHYDLLHQPFDTISNGGSIQVRCICSGRFYQGLAPAVLNRHSKAARYKVRHGMAWTATEWSALGSVLAGAGTVIGAIAVIVAAKLGSETFKDWRLQKLSERRIEQAERILTATHRARRALGYVRSPLMRAAELDTAEAQLENRDDWKVVTSDRKKRLTSVQGYYNRLNAVQDEMRAVEDCLPMARALFGEHIEKALELLNRQFYMVQIAVESNSWEGNDREFTRSLSADLSSATSGDHPNKMNLLIDEQVKLIEEALVPVLQLEAK
jgi:hypothetical protein